MVQILNLITHRNDNTAVIPPRELKKLVYGPDSVFARGPTAAQVAGMTQADVAEFLQKWERPDNAVFGMAGELTLFGTIAISMMHTKSLHDITTAECFLDAGMWLSSCHVGLRIAYFSSCA